MSATDPIKQVAALSPGEKTLFEELFQAMRNSSDGSSTARYSKWPDFGERLHGIYGDKVAPDSQNIIEEGRGGR